ncbi:MAG: HPr(Ser) kinase/phosphatase [Pygmaiobacter massiliensis]|nr:HPr(Ser) kinase/phosphatase [Pygmaiobacter massiliensis]
MQFKVSLSKLVKELHMEVRYSPCPVEDVMVTNADVNRPGLLLAGYKEYFDPTRIQVLGKTETSYLEAMAQPDHQARLEELFSTHPVAVVLARGLVPSEAMLELARRYEVPFLTSAENTSALTSAVTSILGVDLAPRITRHGVLVEVYGEGILILGESGVGKSETAIELVKRGHRFIADDAVELRRVSNRTIVGSAPENIRHFIELRGVGIINVARVFGIGAVKPSERVDMIVELEPWDKAKNYSRIGLESETMELLSVPIPYSVIPVRPGRNLAVILEIAAMNNRQKKMGYNAAEELLEKLGMTND